MLYDDDKTGIKIEVVLQEWLMSVIAILCGPDNSKISFPRSLTRITKMFVTLQAMSGSARPLKWLKILLASDSVALNGYHPAAYKSRVIDLYPFSVDTHKMLLYEIFFNYKKVFITPSSCRS